MLKIIVCVKQVTDPEAPPSTYTIDRDLNKVIVKGAPPVLNPFDENAVEAALRIKDGQPCEISVMSLGFKLSRPVLRKVLAAGADELYLLEDEIFQDIDYFKVAYILSTAIKKKGDFDLILTGLQSADNNNGIIGSGIATLLGIPCITSCRSLELIDGKLKVKRMLSNGYEFVESSFPCLLTICHEFGELRPVTISSITSVQKKPITVWSNNELNIDLSISDRARLVKVFIPQREKVCDFITGVTESEAGEKLAIKLREEKII